MKCDVTGCFTSVTTHARLIDCNTRIISRDSQVFLCSVVDATNNVISHYHSPNLLQLPLMHSTTAAQKFLNSCLSSSCIAWIVSMIDFAEVSRATPFSSVIVTLA